MAAVGVVIKPEPILQGYFYVSLMSLNWMKQ